MAENSNADGKLDDLVSLNFKITERERREFKVWCTERGLTQLEAFRKGIELLRKQDQNSK